ncbi:MAG: amidohydrolase family protein [Phycisphaerales bacterium]|nr:amidohydrolase family protein [Phycisphaerales bacterium]
MRFPYAAERKYTPCDASKEDLFALRDKLGFERNVIVQATCHGSDNRALVDALVHSNGRARGVATVKRTITDLELGELHCAGVRGARFNFLKRLVDFTPKDELMEIAQRIVPFGWHVAIYFEAADLPELWDVLTGLPTMVVVDHMGRPEGRMNVSRSYPRRYRILSTPSWTVNARPSASTSTSFATRASIITPTFCCFSKTLPPPICA